MSTNLPLSQQFLKTAIRAACELKAAERASDAETVTVSSRVMERQVELFLQQKTPFDKSSVEELVRQAALGDSLIPRNDFAEACAMVVDEVISEMSRQSGVRVSPDSQAIDPPARPERPASGSADME